MVKIAFHENALMTTGTSIALYDYAFYNQTILKNESIIIFNGLNNANVKSVVERFTKQFTVYAYSNWNQVDQILEKEKCDIFYIIKEGQFDNKISKKIKNIVHCVFNTSQPHGDIYAKISPTINGVNIPIVPHMINLPDINDNMREELNIPQDAVVIGRHGGWNDFDLDYVHFAIDKFTDKFPFIYFLMLNTKPFCKRKKNIIHLDKIIDLKRKTMFINTCNAMIHARYLGETFGLAIGEFSVRNKPIITNIGKNNQHLKILQNKCILYGKTVNSVLKAIIFVCNNINNLHKVDWNMYKNYLPDKVMKIFNEVFIQPLSIK